SAFSSTAFTSSGILFSAPRTTPDPRSNPIRASNKTGFRAMDVPFADGSNGLTRFGDATPCRAPTQRHPSGRSSRGRSVVGRREYWADRKDRAGAEVIRGRGAISSCPSAAQEARGARTLSPDRAPLARGRAPPLAAPCAPGGPPTGGSATTPARRPLPLAG